jgi:hypothetical protein
VALEQVFSENFGFSCQSTFHLLLHNHLHYHPRLAQWARSGRSANSLTNQIKKKLPELWRGLEQGSTNYGPRATSDPRCDFIRPAKEQIIIFAGVVLITTFALKTIYAQFCSNCLLSLIYDNLFSRTLYLVYEMLYFQ